MNNNFDEDYINTKNIISNKDYFSFRFYLFIFYILAVAISFVIYFIFLPASIVFIIIFSITYSFYISSFSYKITMKRYRDLNMSPLWASDVIRGLPFIGLSGIYKKGNSDKNKYGSISSITKGSILKFVFSKFIKSVILTIIFMLVGYLAYLYGR